jgi:hypothetical protein
LNIHGRFPAQFAGTFAGSAASARAVVNGGHVRDARPFRKEDLLASHIADITQQKPLAFSLPPKFSLMIS